MKKIVFLTGTRADYGKIKSLLKTIEASHLFELHVFVTGMHMSKRHGETWREVIRDGYEHFGSFFGSLRILGHVPRLGPDHDKFYSLCHRS